MFPHQEMVRPVSSRRRARALSAAGGAAWHLPAQRGDRASGQRVRDRDHEVVAHAGAGAVAEDVQPAGPGRDPGEAGDGAGFRAREIAIVGGERFGPWSNQWYSTSALH